jgi:hypothetical protein
VLSVLQKIKYPLLAPEKEMLHTDNKHVIYRQFGNYFEQILPFSIQNFLLGKGRITLPN